MPDWLDRLAGLRDAATPAALVTIVRCSGSTPAPPGAKVVVAEGGAFWGTVGGGHLEQLVLADALACLAAGECRTFRYPLGAAAGQCCGGVVETFVETLNVRPQLYLFGAGHVGQAVCHVLAGTPFEVHAVDERPEWLERLPEGVRRHAEPWDAFVAGAPFSAERTYVAIMTHRHDTDEAIVAEVLRRPARFLGLIGSQTKWRRFRERLEARGLTSADLDRVRCPIGLDVGGKSPPEVAISVAAQLLAVLHGRPAA